LEAEHQRIDQSYKLRNKLAIFPWMEKWDSASFRFFLIDALNQSIDKTEVFVPIFSYYELNNKYNTKVIESLMTEYPAGTLFTKTSMRAAEPRINFISKLGSELEVDAVFICYSSIKVFKDITGGGGTGSNIKTNIELSLINVRSARNHKRVIKGEFTDTDLRLLMEKSLLELFSEFSKKNE